MAAPTFVWFIETPISIGVAASEYVLLETGDKIILEDGTGFLLLEQYPIRDIDKSQLLIGCSLVFGVGNNIDYLRRYLNDKGVFT